MKLLKI